MPTEGKERNAMPALGKPKLLPVRGRWDIHPMVDTQINLYALRESVICRMGRMGSSSSISISRALWNLKLNGLKDKMHHITGFDAFRSQWQYCPALLKVGDQSEGDDFTDEALAPILLVEDDPQIHRLMRSYLEQAGYRVESAYSGEEALEILRYMTPSVALLDVKLPGMDGFTTCQRIRELFDFPIIMVTAIDQPDEMVMGFLVGADMYLSKPFLPSELVARIKSILRRYNDWENDVGR